MKIKKILLTGMILSVLVAPSFASAITLDEIQAQLAVLLQQIKLLQSQLPETQDEDDVIQPTCHTSNLWSWDYATQSCKGNVGEGDCDRDADCNTGYCAKDIGKKYGQVSTMDVCEKREQSSCDKEKNCCNKDDDCQYIWYTGGCNTPEYIAKRQKEAQEQGILIGEAPFRENITCACENKICKKREQPSIKVTAPNGGERWQLGNTHTILWTPYENTPALINSSSQVTAYLEKVVNGKYVNIGKIVACGKASIHWEGNLDTCNSGTYPAPGDYYIRVVNNQTGAQDRSDRPFTLIRKDYLNADLKVNNSDNAITIPEGGGTYNVLWKSNAESCRIATSLNGILEPISGLSSSGNRSIRLNPNFYSYEQALILYCTSKNEIEGSTYDQVAITANSANDFIQIISPNGGESIKLTDRVYISWGGATKGSNMEKVSIALYKNDKSYRWLVTDMPTSGGNYFYYWIPSDILSSNEVGDNVFKIYIIGYKTGGGSVTDISDRPFSIVAPTPQPSITVISPNGGERWEINSQQGIKWNAPSAGFQASIFLADARNASKSWRLFDTAAGYAGVNTIPWSVGEGTAPHANVTGKPGVGSYYIQVCQRLDGHQYVNCDYSDWSFSIVPPTPQPSITVTSPNGGETYTKGSPIQFGWSQNYDVNSVEVSLYSPTILGDLLSSVQSGGSLGKNAGILSGGATNVPAGPYKITICDHNTNNPLIPKPLCDSSDNYFSIVPLQPTCTDTDGGKNYGVKGSVLGIHPDDGINYNISDGCHDFTHLVEYYCEGNLSRGTGLISCSNGCQDGKCIASP